MRMMKLLNLFLLLPLFCAGSYGAAPEMGLESGLRLSTPAVVHCAVPVSGGYRMYFSSSIPSSDTVHILSAVSSDGLSWTQENGVRLSTGASGADEKAVTSMGVYWDPAQASYPYRAYYIGKDSSGKYSVLTATSTDGLTWHKVPSFSLQFGGGRYVNSPSPYPAGSGKVYLYYVRDNAGSGNPLDYRAYFSQSSDSGLTFSGETAILASTPAYSVAISTLNDGRYRLFIEAPLSGGTTASGLLSLSGSSAYALLPEGGTVFSTNSAVNALSGLAVVRSTDAYNWRAYLTSSLGSSASGYIYSLVTSTPVLSSFSPSSVYISDPATDFTLEGEIFASTPSVVIYRGANTLVTQSVTRNSDIRLTVRAVPTNEDVGSYNVRAVNPDGTWSEISDALLLTYRQGYVSTLDNLFRPLKGGKARVDVNIYLAGNISVKAYTLNGELVKTVYSGPAAAGMSSYFWSGDKDGGGTVASGLYILHIKGPKTDVKEKVVVVK